MGSALIKLKDYESGALRLEEALALNSSETNILFALGVVYYKLGNLSLSKAYFASVLELDPGHEEAKGLMDIMASLERTQPAAAQEDVPGDSAGGDDH
jgi:tetratricopeptide (TPR) repeat protein